MLKKLSAVAKGRDIQQSVVAYQMPSLSQHDAICFVQLRSVATMQLLLMSA